MNRVMVGVIANNDGIKNASKSNPVSLRGAGVKTVNDGDSSSESDYQMKWD